MHIELNPGVINGLQAKNSQKKSDQVATSFEKIFDRQLVQEMTKGLFQQDDNNTVLGAGSGIYRQHVIDSLSRELAKQHQLGMADMVRHYINQRVRTNKNHGKSD